MDECELCHGLRGHARLKDAMFASFDSEYQRARAELRRLERLYKHACWYNFEVHCRSWTNPWHESLGGCGIALSRWYRGSVEDAPALPVEILETEVRLAMAEVERCDEQRFAPYEWAPGGRKYEQMRRESPGAAAYDVLHTHAARSARS